MLMKNMVLHRAPKKARRSKRMFSEPFIYFCFAGFSGGAYALVAPYYVSEIAETSMRGALASLMQLMATFGVLFVNALNIYEPVDWVVISATCTAIPGINYGLKFVRNLI